MKKLLITLALLGSIAASQAQSTNTVNFVLPISRESWLTLTNAYLAHQAAVTLQPTNYGGRTVTRTLVVTNEATQQGYFTNVVTWSNPKTSFQAFRLKCAEKMGLEKQLVEAATAAGDAANRWIAPPLVATNNPAE